MNRTQYLQAHRIVRLKGPCPLIARRAMDALQRARRDPLAYRQWVALRFGLAELAAEILFVHGRFAHGMRIHPINRKAMKA